VLLSRVEAYNQAGIPGVMSHATFENYQSGPHESQDHARQVAARFTQEYRKGTPNRGFIIGGPVGSGKTHLLTAALRQLALEIGERIRYVEASLLYATIRRGFQEGKSGGEIIGPLSEIDVLAIDEMGRGRGSAFEFETLEELIARRYNAGKTTLFATNYSLQPDRRGAKPVVHRSTEELKNASSRESEALHERVGARIYSRLCEMCQFVELSDETPDRRYVKHELMQSTPRPRAKLPLR
jgi:DNA replication protein DnaC